MTSAELIGLVLLSGLAAADAAAAFQVMIGQPIVCGWLAGCLLGQPALGLFIGVLLQLLWSRLAPVGATAYPDVGPAAIAGVAVAAALLTRGTTWSPAPGAIFPPAPFVPAALLGLLAAILTGRLGQILTVAERRGNARLAAAADRAAEQGSFAGVERANAMGVVRSLSRGVIVLVPALIAARFLERNPAWMTSLFPSGGGVLGLVAFAWFGVAALLTVLYRGGRGDWAVLGGGLLLGGLVRGFLLR